MPDNGIQLEPSVAGVYERNRNIGITSSDAQLAMVRDVLNGHTKERRGLETFFYKDGLSEDHIKQAGKMFVELERKGCSKELAQNLSILVLYDLVMLIGL